MAEADVLGDDLLVDAAGEHDALLGEDGQQVGTLDAVGEVDGGHAVSLLVRVGGNLLQAEVGDGLLDLVGPDLVPGEPLSQGPGQDLGQRGVQRVDELR